MEKHIPKVETRFDELVGSVSVNFREGIHFMDFAKTIAAIDLEKYEPISIRVFFQNEVVITIYAIDKENYQNHKEKTGNLLLKKFKVTNISLVQLSNYIKQIDCTMVNGDYNIEEFEVEN